RRPRIRRGRIRRGRRIRISGLVRYPFLVLSLLLAAPGVLAYLGRRDLRSAIHFAVPFSLPFALTEPFFYPEYWRPEFLFDLADRIGFGIEDVLFVAALAAITVVSYPLVARRTLAPIAGERTDLRARARRAGLLLAGVAAITALAALASLPMIYGCLFAMVAGSAIAWLPRPDLRAPSVIGALVTTAIYGVTCLLLAALDPQVFHSVWRTRELTAVFVLGVPLEELLYGAATGFAGTIFVPFVRGERFVPLSAPAAVSMIPASSPSRAPTREPIARSPGTRRAAPPRQS
ncbi:MAG: lycopene cyclase domain-containing protein, partial [Myxococcota bacterium]|nr:lycopene cyclase domain-containing protein [Myxococcota bacterium]